MDWIRLIEEPSPVVPPLGIIYSTSPQRALATDRHAYYLKGPDLKVVFAETAAYQLAALVGLNVPHCGLANVPNPARVFFASREVRTRSAVDNLLKRGKATNPDLLAQAVVFDIWIANVDRNVGNILGEPHDGDGTGAVRLCAIDFEKSLVLSGVDRFTVTALPTRRMWPTGDLGQACRRLGLPAAFCARVAAISRQQIAALIHRAIWDLNMPEVPWVDTAVDVLTQRASGILAFANEVWND